MHTVTDEEQQTHRFSVGAGRPVAVMPVKHMLQEQEAEEPGGDSDVDGGYVTHPRDAPGQKVEESAADKRTR